MSLFSVTLLLAALASPTNGHMSIWARGMYGVNNDGRFKYDLNAGDPVAPLGPNWKNQDDWWFRGPAARKLPPAPGVVEILPAGGKWNVEIACHKDWTKYGHFPTVPGSKLDACPGAYHSGDPSADDIDRTQLSGCVLGIADVDDIEKVTMDNFAIFSVRHACIAQKQTSFDIPRMMPACTGKKCICGWMWLANQGIGNFYMTAFDCQVTNVNPNATAIAPPVDPTWCDRNELAAGRCTTQSGAKRPLYVYNLPTNIKQWKGNGDRPGYHANWSFGKDGAQDDIFLPDTDTSPAPSATVDPTNASPPASPANSTAPAQSSSSAQHSTSPPANTASSASVPSSSSASPSSSADLPKATPPANLALTAFADASTTVGDQIAARVIDGVVSGYKEDNTGDSSKEWVSRHELQGAWVRLSYIKPITINQIVLYDRPNLVDQITSATITFSDNSVITTGPLRNNGSANYINLAKPKTITSLTLKVSSTRPGASMIGLAEIQLYNVDPSTFTEKPRTPRTPRTSPSRRSDLARHPRDFSSGEDEAGAEETAMLLTDATLVKRTAGRDLVEESLFE